MRADVRKPLNLARWFWWMEVMHWAHAVQIGPDSGKFPERLEFADLNGSENGSKLIQV